MMVLRHKLLIRVWLNYSYNKHGLVVSVAKLVVLTSSCLSNFSSQVNKADFFLEKKGARSCFGTGGS